MMKKILVVVLCVCMLFNFAAQPVHAMGAEGIIIGGAAAAGVTLTIGQVALIAAAGFGLIYAATHADELGAMLESALSSAASNDETRLEQLTNWKTGALGGFIALATAPAWIKGVINNWGGDLHESANAISLPVPIVTSVTAGEWLKPAAFWTEGSDILHSPGGYAVRAGKAYIENGYYKTAAYLALIHEGTISGWSKITANGVTYSAYRYVALTEWPVERGLEGTNKMIYELCSALPTPESLGIAGSPTAADFAWVWVKGKYDNLESNGDSICPDATIGGVGNALEEHSIDNINIPDINVGQSDLLVPDNTASINDTLNDVLSRLEQQELTWQQYMDDVAVGTPTVSVPAEGTQTGTLEYPLTDTGVSDTPIDTTQPDNPSMTIPEGIEPYTIDLRNFFPFCIPFDIVKLVNTLCAEPEAPCFTWGIATPDGGTEELEVDLAVFDPVAEILRGMELLLFCIGLAFLTRALIRG